MTLNIHSLALALPRVRLHPNRQPFRGLLTLVDSASDKITARARRLASRNSNPASPNSSAPTLT